MESPIVSQLFNNATVLVTNFVEQAKHYNPDLYSSIDLTQLNWLERQWTAWYSYWGNPIIATGIMSFVMHEVSSLFFFGGNQSGVAIKERVKLTLSLLISSCTLEDVFLG